MTAPDLIGDYLPAGAVAAEIHDTGQYIALREAEADFIVSAGPKRRRDFVLGRHCAHLALARLGNETRSLPPGPHGAPLWPAGVVGSITHTHGYAAAIAAPASLFRGVGVDAERVGGVTPALYARLFCEEERAMIAALPPDAREVAATILFSAKEAYYKAAAGSDPLVFCALRVRLDKERFTVTPDKDAGLAASGAYGVSQSIALTVVGLPV